MNDVDKYVDDDADVSDDDSLQVHDQVEVDIPTELKAVLPDGYNYILSDFSLKETGFDAKLKIDSEDADRWKSDFSEASKCTWRVHRTFPRSGKYVLFKKDYRCHHGQQRKLKEGKSRHSKDMGCSSSLHITVRRSTISRGRMSRSSDPHMTTHPTRVTLLWHHNHDISVPAALKFRDVNSSTADKLVELFQNGHSPSSALNMLQLELQYDDPEGYVLKSGDRSFCPDLQFCYRLYYKIYSRAYGSSDGPALIAAIDDDIITKYNQEAGSTCVKMARTSSDQLIIAVCTPMMQRVHIMGVHSSELVFIDSAGKVDRDGSRVFLLLTHSSSGGLPLGVLIASNEQEQTIAEGLKLLQSIFPSDAFGGNGERGPAIFITEDCLAERKAIHSVYPQASLLLCTFHILQAVWRWLWDGKHKVDKCHRQYLFGYAKKMVHAESIGDLDAAYYQAFSDQTVIRYPGYVIFLKALYDQRDEWAQAFRLSLMTRSNNTNSSAIEAALRVLKDSILKRSKAFNVPQLLDFVLCRIESFYERKLLADVNQNQQSPVWRIGPHGRSTISKEDITKTGESTFTVTSQRNKAINYTIDMKVGVCSCQEGRTGGACKHQEAILHHHAVPCTNVLPTTPPERAVLLKIATGTSQFDELVEEVHDMFSEMEEKLRNDPETFAEPFKAMLQAHRTLKTDHSSLASAITMFGRDTAPTSLPPRKRLRPR